MSLKKKREVEMNPGKVIGIVVTGIAALFVLIGVFSSWTLISPGYVGVMFNQWTGGLHTVPQGLAWKTPFVTTVQSYPIALRTYTMVKKAEEGSSNGDDSLDLPTREGQHIRQDLSVTYNTSETKAANVFRAFKGADIGDVENTFIRRTIITAAQNVAGGMSLTELISTQRDKLQDEIQKVLTVELDKMGFTLDKVNLGASHLPQSVETAMQEKMKLQQEAQQAEYTLQKNQTLAKAKKAEAEGDAAAIRVKADAQAYANKQLQVTLTPLLIEQMKIQKWDGTLPQIMGAGAVPIMNFKTGKAEKSE